MVAQSIVLANTSRLYSGYYVWLWHRKLGLDSRLRPSFYTVNDDPTTLQKWPEPFPTMTRPLSDTQPYPNVTGTLSDNDPKLLTNRNAPRTMGTQGATNAA